MPEIILITLTIGSVIFGVGLLSAFKSRKRHASRAESKRGLREHLVFERQEVKIRPMSSSAANMAAQGLTNLANGEEQFATVGNTPR